MNICQEKERLAKLKYEAEAKCREARPGSTIPLGQNTPEKQTYDYIIKQKKLNQEHDEAKEQCELHKKSCHFCSIL